MSGDPAVPGATWRRAALDRLGTERFDVLVVGGGITGAGIARDAAMRGLRTALVDATDFGAGTSSRSSRLVHGGVRYLEHGHLHLVFESSRERRTLLRIAPHLVRPLAFTWPVYAGARVGRWKLAAGLALYDALALFGNVERHRRLSTADVLAREPRLRLEGLVGGALYYDAATDDSRLTLANAVAAAEAGAVVLNHAAVRALIRREGKVTGAAVEDLLGRSTVSVTATVVVNATGPWSDVFRRLDEPEARTTLRGAKGAHIAVRADRVGNAGAVTMLSAVDGRVMFVLPGDSRTTIIGTTETPTAAAPTDVRADADDVAYLLRSANSFFPTAALTADDVVAAWAGIRPLAAGGGSGSTAGASREHAIERAPSGLVSVTGGKLTTYRSMAAEVVDVIERATFRKPTAPRTDRVPLPGGDMPRGLSDAEDAARRETGDAAVARRLARAYGARWRNVWSLAERERALARPIAEGLPYVAAEAVFAASREMAATVGDVLVRRTHLAFETGDAALSLAPAVAALMAPSLGWSEAAQADAVRAYEREARRLFAVDAPGRAEGAV